MAVRGWIARLALRTVGSAFPWAASGDVTGVPRVRLILYQRPKAGRDRRGTLDVVPGIAPAAPLEAI